MYYNSYKYCQGNPPAYSGSVGEPVFIDEDTIEPVALDEMKAYLRIDSSETAFDQEITELISAARQEVETYLNRSLINRTVEVTMNIAGGNAPLPYAPVKELVSIKDTEDNDITEYRLKGDVLKTDSYYQLSLTYTAGYEVVPVAIKMGIKRLVAFDNEHKGDDGTKRDIGNITGLKKYRRIV